jgi:hypothetical protein
MDLSEFVEELHSMISIIEEERTVDDTLQEAVELQKENIDIVNRGKKHLAETEQVHPTQSHFGI